MSGGEEKADRKLDRQLLPENYAVARDRWAVVCQVVADHEGASIAALRFAGGGETRAGPQLIRARRFSCYLAQTAADLSGHALSNVSRLTRKTIREHVRVVEDERDDAMVSAELDALTAEIQLILARRAFVAHRRQQVAAGDVTLTPAWRQQLDPVLAGLLKAWERAEKAASSWRALLANEAGGLEVSKPLLSPPSGQEFVGEGASDAA